MLVDHDPSHIMALIDEALVDREKKREQIREVEDMALGALTDEAVDENPENLAFATSAMLQSQMVQLPRASITSHGGPEERMFAAAVQGATNQVVRQSKLVNAMRSCAWDYTMGWCAMFVGSAPTHRTDPTDAERAKIKGPLSNGIASPAGPANPMKRIRPEWPTPGYLHPDRFYHDTKARTKDEWEFLGHSNIETHKGLLQRGEADPSFWYVSRIREMKEVEDSLLLQYALSRGERTICRGKVVYYIHYEPDGKIEGQEPGPWEYGVIRTIAPTLMMGSHGAAKVTGGVEIRRPYYWKGHPLGPYVHAGQCTHTRDTFPFTSILANLGSVQMLNSAAAALYQQIRQHTTRFAYDAKHQAAIEDLQKAPDGAWVPVPNLVEGMIQIIETGGPTPAMVRELALLQARTAANLALDDAMRGRVDPNSTATAIKQVAATTASRSSFYLAGWKVFVAEVLERIAAHIVMSDTFFIRLDDEGRDEYRRATMEAALPHIVRSTGLRLTSSDTESLVRSSKPIGIPFVGGDMKERPTAWWDLQLAVRAESADEDGGIGASLREQTIDQILGYYGNAMLTMPHINWKQRAREHFAAIGAPGMERLLDEERASTLVGLQLMSAEPVLQSETATGKKPELPALGGGVSTSSSSAGFDSGAGVGAGAGMGDGGGGGASIGGME